MAQSNFIIHSNLQTALSKNNNQRLRTLKAQGKLRDKLYLYLHYISNDLYIKQKNNVKPKTKEYAGRVI